MKKIVVFGAGNIGRSLIGQIFSRAGYEVVFIDIDDKIVNALNERRRYKIEIKDVHPETIWVENVRAVHGKDVEKVTDEIATADIMATAVGANNLRYIYGNIAKGLLKRYKLNRRPLDILICENVRNSSKIFKEGLSKHLPEDYPIDSMVGLVETCIGKMVPIMTEEQRREDPLLIFAEADNTFIVDKKAFRGEVPEEVKELEAKENITAYIDRKLFIHNMGHAITAYLGYLTDPDMKYIWQAISEKNIRRAVEGAMWESGRALIAEYPDFNEENMKEYIDDIIRRFGNKALGDTIFRVGRDLPRKLSRNDRLIGALLLTVKHQVPAPCITLGVAAAMLFRGKDEKGKLFEKDRVFAEELSSNGIDFILKEICGLDFERDKNLVDNIKEAYDFITRDPKNWPSWLNIKKNPS